MLSLILPRPCAKRPVEQTSGESLLYAVWSADAFAPILEADLEQARNTQHLTDCGEIAAVAGAKRLVPFHFSRWCR